MIEEVEERRENQPRTWKNERRTKKIGENNFLMNLIESYAFVYAGAYCDIL